MWEFIGRKRPPFAEALGPGQESVWDYPRPPRLLPTDVMSWSGWGRRLSPTGAQPFGFWKPPDRRRFTFRQKTFAASFCSPFRAHRCASRKGGKYWALKLRRQRVKRWLGVIRPPSRRMN